MKKFQLGDLVTIVEDSTSNYNHFGRATVHGFTPDCPQPGKVVQTDPNAGVYLIEYTREVNGTTKTMRLGFHVNYLEPRNTTLNPSEDKLAPGNIKNLTVGQYYCVTLGYDKERFCIIRYDSDRDEDRINGPTVSSMNTDGDRFEFESNEEGGACWITNRPMRIATPEEQDWLERCEKAGKLVPRDKSETEDSGLSHEDIEEGSYYHLTFLKEGGGELDGSPSIILTKSKDDEYRWTGPCIHDCDTEPMFEDGSEDDHGCYFGGEVDYEEVRIRYATEDEINWLNACIDEGELVEKPVTKESSEKYITRITPEMVGKEITCEIQDKVITDGKIQFQNGQYFICQNKMSGASCADKMGYECSWTVEDGSVRGLRAGEVTKLSLKESATPPVPSDIDPEVLIELIINAKVK